MTKKHWAALLCVLLAACSRDIPGVQPGQPWPKLPGNEMRAFGSGRALLAREFFARDGLGPTFNQSRCSSCHDVPTLGGAGVERVQKATRFESGRCDLLAAEGGDHFQQRITAQLRAQGFFPEQVSRNATSTVSMAPAQLYGLGALEAIPEKEILKREDANDANGDGISGRAGRAADGALGRFGRKATFSSIRAFTENALTTEMGLTTRAFPREQNVGGVEVPKAADPARDPEISDEQVTQLTRFIQLLGFPHSNVPRAARDTVAQGKRIFSRLGCASCHTPELHTGSSDIRGLNQRTVPLYSDLLLHDMGPGLASVCATGASPSEWRTAPLYGLRLRPQLLHDGRVQTIESAIRLHGGEAESSRSLYETLSPQENAALLRFLATL